MCARAIFTAFSTASAPLFTNRRFLGKLARRDLVHALGQTNVSFVRRDLDAGMKKAIELCLDRVDHRLAPMSHVEAADAAGEIEIAVAVDIFEPCVFRLGHINGRANRESARNGVGTARGQRFRLWSGNRSF